jgi:putative ABC transport system permease protein
MSASPGYFSVFHIPILRGRDFTEQDTGSAPGVVLINQTMEKKFWPKGDAVGQQLLIGKGIGPSSPRPPARSLASSAISATVASITIPARS